jgi:hypothetical protein
MTDLTAAQTLVSCAAFLLLHGLFYYVWTAHNDPVYLPGHEMTLPTFGESDSLSPLLASTD